MAEYEQQTLFDDNPAYGDFVDKFKPKQTRQMPKYEYPPHVLTAAMLQKYSKYGIELAVTKKDCMPISKLDAQVGTGKPYSAAGCSYPSGLPQSGLPQSGLPQSGLP